MWEPLGRKQPLPDDQINTREVHLAKLAGMRFLLSYWPGVCFWQNCFLLFAAPPAPFL